MRISDWSSDVCSSDLRPRFDMGDEHSAERPALRRVNNPSDVSDAYLDVMTDARTVDMIADLIGPNVKFHHCKINVKRSEEHTSELQSLMRISYAVFCLKKTTNKINNTTSTTRNTHIRYRN